MPCAQGHAFPNPLSTNYIVQALYKRAQRHSWVVKNCAPTVTYFENLIVELHILYILKTHVKFHVNRLLLTIQSINLFLCIILDFKTRNLKF